MNLLPLILLGLLGAEEIVDSFQFANVQQARQAWVAKDGTPPVELLPSPAYNGGGLKQAVGPSLSSPCNMDIKYWGP